MEQKNNIVLLGSIKKTFTMSEILRLAKGKKVFTVIPGKFSEVEYKAIDLGDFKTAYFLLNNKTFNYIYSHTYNAKKDKTTKRLPKGF